MKHSIWFSFQVLISSALFCVDELWIVLFEIFPESFVASFFPNHLLHPFSAENFCEKALTSTFRFAFFPHIRWLFRVAQFWTVKSPYDRLQLLIWFWNYRNDFELLITHFVYFLSILASKSAHFVKHQFQRISKNCSRNISVLEIFDHLLCWCFFLPLRKKYQRETIVTLEPYSNAES